MSPLLLGALLAGCGGCSGCRAGAPPPALAPEAAQAPSAVAAPPPGPDPARKGRPRTGREALGVNEGVSIPQALVGRGETAPEGEDALLAADARDLVELGVGLVRANTATYPWLSWWSHRERERGFLRADRWVQTVQAAGLEPLLMVGPWPGNRTASYTDAYVPADLGAYTTWLQGVVERYDGDGVDDMPGLRAPVRYWEVDNEPDLHNTVPPRGGKAEVDPASFETPAEYARVLVASAAAIRAADPAAVVLSAGFYRPHTAPGRAWIAQVLAEPGAREAFDVLSLHCYFDQDDLGKVQATLDTWKALAPEKALWVTETGVPSEGKGPWIDAEWQARMAVAVVGGFLAGGADRVLWHTLADPPAGPHSRSSPFAHHSLRAMSADGTAADKPAGATWRRMAARLGPADPATFAEVPAEGGRLLRVGEGWLAFWGAPVPPPGAALVEDLRTGQQQPVGATVQAPAFLLPAGAGAPDAAPATGG